MIIHECKCTPGVQTLQTFITVSLSKLKCVLSFFQSPFLLSTDEFHLRDNGTFSLERSTTIRYSVTLMNGRIESKCSFICMLTRKDQKHPFTFVISVHFQFRMSDSRRDPEYTTSFFYSIDCLQYITLNTTLVLDQICSHIVTKCVSTRTAEANVFRQNAESAQ